MRFSDIVFYNKGRGPSDGNNYWRRVTGPHFVWVGVMLALAGAALGFSCLYAAAKLSGIAFMSFFSRPMLVVLNVAPCVLAALFLFFLTGRAWLAYLLTGLLTVAAMLLPLLPAWANGAGAALGELGRWVAGSPTILALPAAWLLGTLFCVFLLPGVFKSGEARISGAFLCGLCMATLLLTVYTSPMLYRYIHLGDAAEAEGWALRGYLYPLLYRLMNGVPV